DLALALPPEKLPVVQIKLIEKANDKAVPVIVATQMLLSMVKQRIPTRAEVSDVSYSVMQGADAVMLSEETSVGADPVRAVKMMRRIIVEALSNFNFDQYKLRLTALGQTNIVEAICYAAAAAGFKLNSRALVACTTSGYSVRLLSKYRPKPPVLAYAHSEEVVRRLSLCWGVESVLAEYKADNDRQERDQAFEAARRKLNFRKGDTVILLGGVKTFQIGGTSLMEIRQM
ncbi:MAG: pyruvate kinase, partial [Deltaproteobacteria bacterium]|nr:pyruvate kinase [Deltaproteobacteria bacterium]